MSARRSNAEMAHGAEFFLATEDLAALERLPAPLRAEVAAAHLPIAMPSLLEGWRRRLLARRGAAETAIAWHLSDIRAALAGERQAFSALYQQRYRHGYGSTAVGVEPLGYDGWGQPSRHPPRPIGKPVLHNRGRRRKGRS